MSTSTYNRVQKMIEDAAIVRILTTGTADDVREMLKRKPNLLHGMNDQEGMFSPILVIYYSDNPHKVDILRVFQEEKPELELVDEYDLEADTGEAREVLQQILEDWYTEIREDEEGEWEEWKAEREARIQWRRNQDRGVEAQKRVF